MLRSRPVADRKDAAAIAARDHAMLEVFYARRLRVSEIIGVKLEDLKLDLGCMLVRGKGDKERIVPLGKGAQDALTDYIKSLAPDSREREDVTTAIPGSRREETDASTGLADGSRRIRRCGSQCQPAHAATQLRHPHGGERRRFAHGADDPRSCRYFDDAGLHPPGIGPTEECVSETSSASENEAEFVARTADGTVGATRVGAS